MGPGDDRRRPDDRARLLATQPARPVADPVGHLLRARGASFFGVRAGLRGARGVMSPSSNTAVAYAERGWRVAGSRAAAPTFGLRSGRPGRGPVVPGALVAAV